MLDDNHPTQTEKYFEEMEQINTQPENVCYGEGIVYKIPRKLLPSSGKQTTLDDPNIYHKKVKSL